MRVTYLLRCLTMMRGGGETQHLSWIHALMKMGVEIDIITGRPWLQPSRYPVEGIPTTVVRSPYLRDVVYRLQGHRIVGRLASFALHVDEEWFCRLAWSQIASRGVTPDLVLAHALHQAPRLRTLDLPVAVYLPGPPHRRYLADLRAADGLISDGWAAKHLPAMVGRPVDDVVKGVDTELFTPEGPNKRAEYGLVGKKVVLSVTRLVPIKNVTLLVDSIAELGRERSDVVLLLVGEGPERALLEARARQLGAAEAVRFVGYVAQRETAAWYRSADVFALTSDFDNSPNVILEAMASGLSIVATDVGGLREYISPSRNGFLVAKGSQRELTTALSAVLADEARARSMAAINREDALARFAWPASARRMLAVYERIVAGHRGRSREPLSATA